MVISMVVGVDGIVNVGVVDMADNPVVIVGVGVLDAGLVIIPGVIVTFGAALAVLQAERTTAAEQNNKKVFMNINTSKIIIRFLAWDQLDMHERSLF